MGAVRSRDLIKLCRSLWRVSGSQYSMDVVSYKLGAWYALHRVLWSRMFWWLACDKTTDSVDHVPHFIDQRRAKPSATPCAFSFLTTKYTFLLKPLHYCPSLSAYSRSNLVHSNRTSLLVQLPSILASKPLQSTNPQPWQRSIIMTKSNSKNSSSSNNYSTSAGAMKQPAVSRGNIRASCYAVDAVTASLSSYHYCSTRAAGMSSSSFHYALSLHHANVSL